MQLKDSIIVVTGAGSGIGRALVKGFTAEGAKSIVAVDLDEANVNATASEFGCTAMTADVSSEEDIRRVVEEWKPHAIHVHDFDLVPTTVTLARDYDLPVVADLHENLPAAVEQYLQWAKPTVKVKNLLINHPVKMRKMERVSLPQCRLVITVVPPPAVSNGVSRRTLMPLDDPPGTFRGATVAPSLNW